MNQKTMQPTRVLSRAAQFFFDHAGYSHDPLTETPEQGRTRCAIALAEAELLYLEAHRVADVVCVWEDDPAGFADYRADKKAGRLAEGIGKPRTIELADIRHGDEYLASLGGIWDADENYRRVVRAELARERADELRKIIEAAGGSDA